MKKELNGDNILSIEDFQKLIRPLIDLIARTSIWVDPANVSNTPVYPDKKRGKPADKGKVIDGIKIDDNTYANKAIKRAISKDIDFVNYTACHIWPGTTYDERYHTQLANLVLIPRVIAGLSDFCPAVVDVLKYRAFSLYGWHPEELAEPLRPDYYPEHWSDIEVLPTIIPDEEPMDLEEYLDQEDSYSQKLEEYNENREEIEIEKVQRKVPGWISKPDQICSIILEEFMSLSTNGEKPIEKEQLRVACINRGVDKFEGNYNQMKNFGFRNHAKVFQEENNFVYLWRPVGIYIKRLFK